MNINKAIEDFSTVQSYATLIGRKAMLFFKRENLFFGVQEYMTYVEKIDEDIKRKDRKTVTLRFANNVMQTVSVDINEDIKENSIVYSLGYFVYYMFGGPFYEPISKFSSISMTDKCNSLKAYKQTEKTELSEAKEADGYSDWYIYKIYPLSDTGLYYKFDTVCYDTKGLP